MVTAVTNLGRSGLYDWLVQRISGVILLLYFLCVGSYIGLNPDMTHAQWQAFFSHTSMQVFSVAAILSIALHAWIGLWCVLTDYLTVRMIGQKGNLIRGVVSAVCGVTLFTYVVWGIQIVWMG